MSLTPSSSSRPGPVDVFKWINDGSLGNIRSVQHACQSDNTNELVEYIHSGVKNLSDMQMDEWKIALPKLLTLAEQEANRELYRQIEKICFENGLIQNCHPKDNRPKLLKDLEKLHVNSPDLSEHMNPQEIQKWMLEDTTRRTKIIGLLQDELHTIPNPTQVRELAGLIFEYQEIFKPNDNAFTELMQRAKYAQLLTTEDQLTLPNNPYFVHKELEEIREGQVPKGLPINLDGKLYLFQPSLVEPPIYKRSDVPEELTFAHLKNLFDDFEKRLDDNPKLAIAFLEAIGKVKSDDSEDRMISLGRTIFQNLKSEILNDSRIITLANLPEDKDETIPRPKFYFYSLIHNMMLNSSVCENENTLSDRERCFLTISFTINGCETGKEEKVCELCGYIEPTAQLQPLKNNDIVLSGEKEKLHNRMMTFIEPIYEEYREHVRKLFNNPAFIADLVRENDPYLTPYDLYNQYKFVKNKFGKLVGLPYDLSLDWLSTCISPALRNLTEHQFMEVFLTHSQKFLETLPQMLLELNSKINEKLNENSSYILGTTPSKEVAAQGPYDSKANNLLDDLNELLKYRFSSALDYMELEDDGKMVLKSIATLPILAQMKVIKEKPLIDASLTINQIQEFFPDLQIVDAAFWREQGINITNAPLFYDAKAEIHNFLKSINRIGIEGGDGATLMLLPKEVNEQWLMRMGIPFRYIFEPIDGEITPVTERKTCWVLLANNILKGSTRQSNESHQRTLNQIGCELPDKISMTALAIARVKMRNVRLLNSNPKLNKWSYASLKETYQGYHLAFGGFTSNGPGIYWDGHFEDNLFYSRANLGVLPSRTYYLE